MKMVVLAAAIGIFLTNGAYALIMFNGTNLNGASSNMISMNGTGLNLISFNGANAVGTSGSAPATIDMNALRVVRAVIRH